MKKGWLGNLIVAFFGLSNIFLITNVQADWQCRVYNERGQSWFGHASTRTTAVASAMHYCAHNTREEANCIIDYCHLYHGSPAAQRVVLHPMHAPWQCIIENHAGQVFVGVGRTRASALAQASGHCTAHSPYARTCIVKDCFVR